MRKICLFLLSLLLVSCSSQNIEYDIPTKFEGKISETNYKKIVDLSINAISKKYKIIALKSGTVKTSGGPTLYLDNLINSCIQEKNTSNWNSVAKDHFDRLFESMNLSERLNLDDFKSIKQYLSLRVYPEKYIATYGKEMVYRQDIPGTYTALMFDFPTAFNSVGKSNFRSWGQDTAIAFNEAQKNISKKDIPSETISFDYKNIAKIDVTILEEENYASSFILDLKNNSPQLIGKCGSIIAIPNKQVALIYKLEKEPISGFAWFIDLTDTLVDRFYRQYPPSISNSFFWYYNSEFHPIETERNEQGKAIRIVPPKEMLKVLTDKN